MPEEAAEVEKASRLKLKFGKGTEYTKVFDEWSQSIQAFLLVSVHLEDGELPLVAYYHPTANWISGFSQFLNRNLSTVGWFLLTTRRIIWENPDGLSYELTHANIKNVGWSSGPHGWPGEDISSPPDDMVFVDNGIFPPPFSLSFSENPKSTKGHCKFYSPWLHVIDNSGKRYEVFLEPGESLIRLKSFIRQLSDGCQQSLEQAEKSNQQSMNSLPATGSDAYKAARCERKFFDIGSAWQGNFSDACNIKERFGLFRQFDSAIQKFLLEEAQLAADEIPIFAYFNNQQTWLLATSRTVFWSRPGYRQQLMYSQIVEMGWSIGPTAEPRENANTQDLWIETEAGRQSAKVGSPWLFILDSHGIRHEALLESGFVHNFVWNALRHMCVLDRIHAVPTEV